MNEEVFIKNIEDYYGKYNNNFIKAMVCKYVLNLDEKILKTLCELVFNNYSSKYKTVPDIAAIEEVRRANIKQLGEYIDSSGNIYDGGKRIGHYDRSRFIPYLGDLNSDQIKEYANNYKMFDYPDAFKKYLRDCNKDVKRIEDKKD